MKFMFFSVFILKCNPFYTKNKIYGLKLILMVLKMLDEISAKGALRVKDFLLSKNKDLFWDTFLKIFKFNFYTFVKSKLNSHKIQLTYVIFLGDCKVVSVFWLDLAESSVIAIYCGLFKKLLFIFLNQNLILISILIVIMSSLIYIYCRFAFFFSWRYHC